MGAHDGTADLRLFIFGVGGQMLEHFCHTPRSANGCTTGGCFSAAEALRQVALGGFGEVSTENRFDKATIVAGACADTSRLAGKQVVYLLPLIVVKPISGHA